jgi:hypothetical protein
LKLAAFVCRLLHTSVEKRLLRRLGFS